MRRIATVVLLALAVIALWQAVVAAHHPDDSVTIYDPNPSHLWNRLYATLLIREDRQGHRYGAESLDPLLYGYTRHLLEPKSHQRAIKVLDEFLETHGENLIHDPVRRALLTRDLWAVFDWSVARTPEYPRDPSYDPERLELQLRLAQILRRLALTPHEVESLPDNYAQAVASGEFPKEYDPAHPDRAFLPPDLFDQHGPWVGVSSSGQDLPAAQHVSFFSGRSRFLIFIRVPGGRKAAFDYFRQLWEFPQPWIARSDAPTQTDINPSLPSFPAGTEVALVRQMTLFDNHGVLTPAPITESVQIRVYRSVSPPDAAESAGPEDLIARSGQAFFEIRLDRSRLLSARAGGLREVSRDEKEFLLFNAQAHDLLEDHKFTMDWSRAPTVLRQCVWCHQGSGINSLNSRAVLLKPNFLQRDAGYEFPPRWWENDGTVYWKEKRYDWGLLSGYWKAGASQR